MEMKVAVAGHMLVQKENWARWERFAELYPTCEVTLLVQEHWLENRYGVEREFIVEPYKNDNFEVIPLKQWRIGRQFHLSLDMHLRSLKPDILHVIDERYGWWAYQALMYRRLWARSAVTVGFSTTNIEYGLKKMRHILKEKVFFEEMDAIFAVNTEAAKILKRHGYHKPVSIQQENGADERIWTPYNEEPANEDLQKNGFVVGYVGALWEEKGVADLVNALFRIEDFEWTLVVIGEGPMRESLMEMFVCNDKAEQACFVGYKQRKDIPPLMKVMDILVLPSRTTAEVKEQFGLVLAEAMLCKVAVIGSDSGAIPEVIGDAGLIFSEGNIDELKKCIEALMRNPTFRKELAERGYRKALQSYSVTALAKRSYSFFNELLKRNKGR